ncbi:histidine N-acetyltransferase-like [Pecten maximus]|uniref:histidine N-acetyltransferase-like n=1 Tax=Pecten maximus TaxID=6579 RepID=UPI0014584E88|nr:histidine N-acetyltransferase-like [Pecten maximus]
MEGVYCRKTTAEDYDDVISVRENVYNGLDYIPSRYHKFLEFSTGFGGFIDNTMVSFMFATVINDGQSILTHSMRIRKEYERQGLATKTRNYCMQNMSSEAHEKVFVILSSSILEKVLRQTPAHVVFQRNIATFKSTKAAIQTVSMPKSMSASLKNVDEAYLRDVFRHQRACAYLFPENKMILSRLPYKLMPSNIKHIIRPETEILASPNELAFCKDGSLMISAAIKDKCAAGTTMFLDIFGDISDEKNITEHVFEQTKRLSVNCDEDSLMMYLTFPTQQNCDTLFRVLSEYTWTMVEQNIMYGLEQSI